MNRINFYAVVVLFLIGCKSNPKQLIETYEWNTNHIHVSAFKSMESFKPFFASDSLYLLDVDYKLAFKDKIQSLQKQLDDRVLTRQQAESDIETSINPLMKKAIANRIKIIIEEEETLKTIIALYTHSPEKTQLNTFIERRENYAKKPDSFIGITCKVSFKGNYGQLPVEEFKRIYFFNTDKSELIGVLRP